MSSKTAMYSIPNDEWLEIGTGPNLLITYDLDATGTISLCIGDAGEEIPLGAEGHIMTPNDRGVASFSGLPGGTVRVFAKSFAGDTNLIVSEF